MKKVLISLLTVLMIMGTPIVMNFDSPIGIQDVYAAVKINKKTARVLKGKKITLKVTGTKKKVTWSSNKKSIATVNSKGVVTGKKKGTATITAKVGGKKYTCKVTVETPSLNKTNVSITKGKTYQLKLQGTSQKVTWSTSNKSIATVTSSGKVTAKKKGTVYIKAKVQGKTYSCKVTVKNPSVKITPKKGIYVSNTKAKESDPCYTLSITKISSSSISFSICKVGYNASPIYDTHTIKATISGNKTKTFKWTDSWDNQGTGTITFLSKSQISLNMKQTKDGGWGNRSTLACKNLKLTYVKSWY